MEHPKPFLDIIFHQSIDFGDNSALCAGFELGEWRSDQFADHVMEWLPEFALTHAEIKEMGHQNALSILRKAARIVYKTDKYKLRGEFGEMLLHIAIRQIHHTIPAISKIFFKSSANETVKGFDAVHIVKIGDELELWLGETKFYKKASRAISDVTKEIVDHLEKNYLKSEFILIRNKIDSTLPESESLKNLLHENVSLDVIFKRACIPVLLTYESPTVIGSGENDEEYQKKIALEVNKVFSSMRKKLDKAYFDRYSKTLPVTLHVILVPLQDKQKLIDALDFRLKGLQ